MTGNVSSCRRGQNQLMPQLQRAKRLAAWASETGPKCAYARRPDQHRWIKAKPHLHCLQLRTIGLDRRAAPHRTEGGARGLRRI